MATRRIRVRRRHKKRKARIAFTFFILIALLIGGGFYYVSQVYTASFEGLDRGKKSDLRKEPVDIGEDPISILLMGVENYSSNGENGRADTQIVMTLDPETKQMTMTTIPRDTRVYLPEEKVGETYAGMHKINSAYTFGEITGYGGAKLTIETVEELLDIPIDTYATVNFEGFMDIVNLLGGVTIDVKKPFWERSSLEYEKKIYFEEGPTEMNGEEALAFVRMRKRDVAVSYTRDERQRQFLKAVIDEAVSAGTLFKLGQISDVLSKNIQTNLSPREIFAIQNVFSSDESSVKTFEIEGENTRLEDGKYYFLPDEESLEKVSEKLQEALDYTMSPETDDEYSEGFYEESDR